MIKSVKIKNFQVHKNTEIELSPGVNVITGDTDAGKSSLMRALRLVVFNRPTGDSIIRWGEKEVKVSVSTTDNQHIERVKSKKENSYLLNSEELKAVGKDVPERVAQALNLSDTNFQKQLDRPFLLLESPGEIAQFFNSIVGLSDIDKSLYNIQREFSQAKNQLGMYETELDKTKEEHQKYNYLEEVELILKELEIQILESKVLDNEIESLLLFSTQIDRVDKQLAGITIPPDVSSLLLSVQQYNTLNKEYEQVATWFTNLKQINDAISKLPDIPDTSHFSQMFFDYGQLHGEVTLLESYDSKIKDIEEREEQWTKNQLLLETRYQELSKIVCPTCLRPL